MSGCSLCIRRKALLAVCVVLLAGCWASAQQSVQPSMHAVILDFTTEGVGMTITFRVGDEAEATVSVQGRHYAYATTAREGSSVEARVQPVPASAGCGIGLTVDGKSIGGGGNPGVATWEGVVSPASCPAEPRLHRLVLDFTSEAKSMDVTYRVGNGPPTTVVVDGPHFTYSVVAEELSTILTRIVPTPATAWSAVMVTMDGRMLGGSSDLGEVVRTDVLSPDEAPAYGSGLHEVRLLFETDGASMTITYRVGSEEPVTRVVSRSYVYSAAAVDGATILTVLVASKRSAHCSISVTVDGVETGSSSSPGTVFRMDWIH